MRNIFQFDNRKIHDNLYDEYRVLSRRQAQRERAHYKAVLDVFPVVGLYLTFTAGFILNFFAKEIIPQGESNIFSLVTSIGIIVILLIISFYIRFASVSLSVIDNITKNTENRKNRRGKY